MKAFREIELPAGVPGQLWLHSMPGRYEPLDEAWTEARRLGVFSIICLAPLDEIPEKSPDYARAIEEEWRWMATHAGKFRGLAPTGREASLTGIAIYKVEDRKVVQRWVEGNVLARPSAGSRRRGARAPMTSVLGLQAINGAPNKRLERPGLHALRIVELARRPAAQPGRWTGGRESNSENAE